MWKFARIYEPCKIWLFFMRIAVLIVIIIQLVVFLRRRDEMTSFSPILNQNLEQRKLMAAINSRK